MRDEKILAKGIQLRPFAFFHRRFLVAITSSRVIRIERGLLGGFTMRDFQWKDLKDAKLEENVLPSVCGSNLYFSAIEGSVVVDISMEGVASDVAATIYKTAQAEEQAWEEKRRIRTLEEARAKSGGVTVQSGSHTSGLHKEGNGSSMMEELEKAKKLFDSGAITDAEFNELKSKILSKSF